MCSSDLYEVTARSMLWWSWRAYNPVNNRAVSSGTRVGDWSLSSLDSEPPLSGSAHHRGTPSGCSAGPRGCGTEPGPGPPRDRSCHPCSFWECCQRRTLARSSSGHCCQVIRAPCPGSCSASRCSPHPTRAELLEAEAFIETGDSVGAELSGHPGVSVPYSSPGGRGCSQILCLLNSLLIGLCLTALFLRPTRGYRTWVWRELMKETQAEVSGLVEGREAVLEKGAGELP